MPDICKNPLLKGRKKRVYIIDQHNISSDEPFVITINTALGTGSNFQLPLPSGYTYNFTVYWGDGNSDVITAYNQTETLHTYSPGGIYQITIEGKCGGWSFNNGGDRLKITSVDQWGDVDFDYLSNGFYGCSNLTDYPDTIMGANVGITTIGNLFRNCTSLTNTKNNIFKNLVNLTVCSSNFYNCQGLTTIGQELFINNTALINMSTCFYQCTSLPAIPTDFLRYNTSLTNITQMFGNCYALNSIPVDFLRYNTLLTTVSGLFGGGIALNVLPEDLFYYNSLITNYSSVLVNCRNISLPTRLFNLSNLSIVTKFDGFMSTNSTSYSSTGTIQDVWNYATSATSTNAFLNQTALTNYSSIPNGWKGL